MFYCDECGTKEGWPTDFYLPMSKGPCECCGKVRGCFDVPSSALPKKTQGPDGALRVAGVE